MSDILDDLRRGVTAAQEANSATLYMPREYAEQLIEQFGDHPLAKRPVAFRVKDFADGWIVFQNEADAIQEAERTGATMQGLYARTGYAK